MVTDGADTSDAALDESLASLKARSIPVFTVGVGQERFAHDIQVTRVETPRAVLKGTSLVVDVVLSQTGYGGQTVPLSVEDDGRIVSTQEVTLPPDGESATVRVRFTADGRRARALFRFKVPTQAGEQVTQNNARDALIEVSDRAREGPLLRRRAALRDEVHPPRGRRRQEPAGRHPAAHRREQVLPPRRRQRRRADRRLSEDARGAVRLPRAHPRQRRSGVVHARAAADDRRLRQQARRRAADARRPPRRLPKAAGRGTPVGEVLPVDRSRPAERRSTSPSCRCGRRAPARPSRSRRSPATRRRRARTWNDMPPVTTRQPDARRQAGRDRPADRRSTTRKQDQVVLAYQRYGRGKAIALPIQDSWLWRMDAKIAGHRHDARDVLAAPGPLAGRRRARPGQC